MVSDVGDFMHLSVREIKFSFYRYTLIIQTFDYLNILGYKLMKLMKGNMLFSLKTIKICNKQLDSKPQVVVQRLNLEAWPPHRPLGKIPQFFFLGFLPQEPSPLDRTVKVGNKGIEVYEGFPRVILFKYGILRSLVGIKDTQVYGV